MKKSILALLLAVLMVASLLPAAALADEGPEAKIGDKEYDTLALAIADVTDDTLTTITVLRNVTDGTGIKIPSGKNLIIDFNYHTYTLTSTVGSTDTETNSFQLLRDSNITMKNGTIISDCSTSWIIFQNYCNLTLDNMQIDANVGNNSVQYVVSCNYGTTTITGNTNITAKPGQKALDVYYWPSGGYGDGVSVTFDEDMTGTVTGTITYGSDQTEDGKTDCADMAKLNIESGSFVGEFSIYGIDESEKHASINVSGGSFSNPVAPKYLDKSLKYQVNNGNTYTYYDTFEKALAAAQNGAVIENVVQGLGAENFTLTIDPANGGTVLSYSLPKDSPYTLPTVSKSGCAFLGWSDGESTYPAGTVITLTSNVTYTASWVRHPDTPYVPEPEEPEEPEVPEFPFYDVPTSAWYYTAVKYVYDNKLMDGVDTYVFAPNDTLTRAMVWTIIARMSGVDTTGGNTWYAKAQEWVITNGISDGENPTAAITREEFVTMLWRLAGEPIYTGDLSRVPDAGSISTWAQNAMLWSYATGLTEGDENGALTPLATATRAQAAAMIMRFCESVK